MSKLKVRFYIPKHNFHHGKDVKLKVSNFIFFFKNGECKSELPAKDYEVLARILKSSYQVESEVLSEREETVTEKPTGPNLENSDKILEFVRTMDTEDDSIWTKEGYPKIDVISKAIGREDLTRKSVDLSTDKLSRNQLRQELGDGVS